MALIPEFQISADYAEGYEDALDKLVHEILHFILILRFKISICHQGNPLLEILHQTVQILIIHFRKKGERLSVHYMLHNLLERFYVFLQGFLD